MTKLIEEAFLSFIRERDPTVAKAIEMYREHYDFFSDSLKPTGRVPFEEWAEAYGYMVDEKKCRSKYKKIKNSETFIVLEHTKEYVKLLQNATIQQRLPATYLNNQNWRDEGFLSYVRGAGNNKESGKKRDLTPEDLHRIIHS